MATEKPKKITKKTIIAPKKKITSRSTVNKKIVKKVQEKQVVSPFIKVIHTAIVTIGVTIIAVAGIVYSSDEREYDDTTGIASEDKLVEAIDKGIQRYIASQQKVETNKRKEIEEKSQKQAEKNLKPFSSRDHLQGNADAKIFLIEYSDFECPYCGKFHETAQKLIDNSQGKIAWVYRHFPLGFHAGATKKAEASECVNELGGSDAFWKFSDILFKDQKIAVENLTTIAQSVGVNAVSFTNCMTENKYSTYVQDQIKEGSMAGITGTPGNILLNTATGKLKLVPGALPLTMLEDIIKEISS